MGSRSSAVPVTTALVPSCAWADGVMLMPTGPLTGVHQHRGAALDGVVRLGLGHDHRALDGVFEVGLREDRLPVDRDVRLPVDDDVLPAELDRAVLLHDELAASRHERDLF